MIGGSGRGIGDGVAAAVMIAGAIETIVGGGTEVEEAEAQVEVEVKVEAEEEVEVEAETEAEVKVEVEAVLSDRLSMRCDR